MTKQNVILILTDNQQASTLGCYGNDEVHTPNIDKLAERGIRMDQAYCGNAFCSPCRASVMTGMMPSQHGVHSWIDDRNMHEWPKGWNALAGLQTLPEEMQKLGYETGIFGKYHLGDSTVPSPGWDSWVTMADGHVRSFYDNRIFDNGEEYAQPGHSVDFFTDKALEFIEGATKPYFAYIPFPAPYGHWPATNDGNRNRHAELYDDCPVNSVPREGLSAAAVAGYDRKKSGSGQGLDFSMVMRAPNHLPTLRNYYSQITMIDDAVGRIMEADPDALIIFTTDHGLSLGHHGFWGHGGSTFPSNLHLAAHSIPLIIGGGVQNRGNVEIRLVSNTDLYSTILEFVGGDINSNLPSRSFIDLLGMKTNQNWGPEEVIAEQEETRIIRTDRWVYFKRVDAKGAPDIPNELFDLKIDPQEKINLAYDPDYKDIVAGLDARIVAHFDRFARPSADMWTGGPTHTKFNALKPFWKSIWGDDWEPVYSYVD